MAVSTYEMAGVPIPGPCEAWADDAEFIREVLDRIADKWTVLVMVTLADGPLRYSELSQFIPGLSQRMLTRTLKHLTRDGLVSRTSHPQVPPRVEYAVTPLGSTLLAALLDIAKWASAHHAEVLAHRRLVALSG
jgi:DNA-binding HxlR family transcriptional regulator